MTTQELYKKLDGAYRIGQRSGLWQDSEWIMDQLGFLWIADNVVHSHYLAKCVDPLSIPLSERLADSKRHVLAFSA